MSRETFTYRAALSCAALICGVFAFDQAHAGDRSKAKSESGWPKAGKFEPANPHAPQQDLPPAPKGGQRWELIGDDDKDDEGNQKKNYAKFEVRRANIQSKGEACTTSATKKAKAEGSASGADSVVITISGSSQETYDMTVTNPINLKAAWQLTPGAFVAATGEMWAIDMAGGRHDYKVAQSVSGAKSSDKKESKKVKESGSHSASGGGSVHADSRNVEVTVNGEVSKTDSKDTEAEDSYNEKSSSGSGTAGSGGYSVSISESESGTLPHTCTARRISSYAHMLLQVMAAVEGTESSVTLNPFNVTNNIQAAVTIYTPSTEIDESVFVAMVDWPSGSGTALAAYANLEGEMIESGASVGLEGETGRAPGWLAVELNQAAPGTLTFDLSCDPAGAVSFPMGAQIEIATGEWMHSFKYVGEVSGTATVKATLLDASGGPTTDVIEFDVSPASLSTVSETEISVTSTMQREGHLKWVRERNTTDGEITIHRTGFDDADSEATTVTVTVADPNLVLANFPSAIVIPAGELSATEVVSFADAAGTATVTFSYDGESTDVELRSADVTLVTDANLRLPVGATTTFAVDVTPRSGAVRSVTLGTSDPLVATVAGTSTKSLDPAFTFATFEVKGNASGVATLPATSAGLASALTTITVVPEEVNIAGTSLTVNNMSPDREGVIRITLPSGVIFSSVVVPPAAQAYMSVTGSGTGELRMEISQHPSVLSSAILSVVVTGATGTVDAEVWDDYHAENGIDQYTIEVTQ